MVAPGPAAARATAGATTSTRRWEQEPAGPERAPRRRCRSASRNSRQKLTSPPVLISLELGAGLAVTFPVTNDPGQADAAWRSWVGSIGMYDGGRWSALGLLASQAGRRRVESGRPLSGSP